MGDSPLQQDLPTSTQLSTVPPDSHLSAKSIYNDLSLEPNSVFHKHFFARLKFILNFTETRLSSMSRED